MAFAFTLVECVLAIGIISFAFVALLGLLPVGLASFKQGKDKTIETEILKHVAGFVGQAPYSVVVQAPPVGLQGAELAFGETGNALEDFSDSNRIYVARVSVQERTAAPTEGNSGTAYSLERLATIKVSLYRAPAGVSLTNMDPFFVRSFYSGDRGL